ncbi:MAG: aminoglycoside phosphotransferase family protein [Acidobacteria bacterium]|nr:aminoglycoside phosphotransferase family protein [Acidobacteriota bacterium]
MKIVDDTSEPHGKTSPPSAEALRWVADCVGTSAAIESVTPLAGATSSSLHAVRLRHGGGVVELVLRRFVDAAWLALEPDLALHEASSLLKAARAGVPTPELVSFDEDGAKCGVPATLTTLLPGRVELSPSSLEDWTYRLAEPLTCIHAIEAEDYAWSYYPYIKLAGLEPPEWSAHPEHWERAIEVVRGPRPESRECFIHRDYHPNNVLWNEGRVSGVIDWVNSCRGAAGFDAAWCRLNLAQLYGVAGADMFLGAYRSLAGAGFEYHPYWDLIAIVEILPGPPGVYEGWPAFGVTHLNGELIRERLDEYLSSLVERL